MKYTDKKNKKNYKQWKSDLLSVEKETRTSRRRGYAQRQYRRYAPPQDGGGGGGGGLPPVGGEEG